MFSCVDRKEEKSRKWRPGKREKIGQLTLSIEPERVEVHFLIQRATIPSKKIILHL
jgi:hypothetical protein